MIVTVIEDAKVLIPNKEHMNFTESSEIIPEGTELEGEVKLVKGKRRGEEFNYRLFKTKNNQLIYIKKIKPMNTTEVTLGADASTSATVVKVPAKKFFSQTAIAGAAIGLATAYAYCKFYKKSDKLKPIVVLGFAIAGFAAGKFVEHKKAISITKSK
jgi:hypothetical protein